MDSQRRARGSPAVRMWRKILTGEWFIEKTSAHRRRVIHYWATILWLTVGLVAWIILRDALWFVGLMSLYAIWVTHLAGWAAETPVEQEADDGDPAGDGGAGSETAIAAQALSEAEPG